MVILGIVIVVALVIVFIDIRIVPPPLRFSDEILCHFKI